MVANSNIDEVGKTVGTAQNMQFTYLDKFIEVIPHIIKYMKKTFLPKQALFPKILDLHIKL